MFNTTDLLFILPMILIMYFLIFLPKKREQQALNKMLSELKKGDKVLTQAGIIGEVTGMKDNVVTLRISSDGSKADFLKTTIQKLMGDEGSRKNEKNEKAEKLEKPVEAKA
jgi:preprotein translocase subunit YajC